MTATKLRTVRVRKGSASPQDILHAKQALHQLGYYPASAGPLTHHADDDLFAAIVSFQKVHGLTPDGELRPNDETTLAMEKALVGKSDHHEWSVDKRRAQNATIAFYHTHKNDPGIDAKALEAICNSILRDIKDRHYQRALLRARTQLKQYGSITEVESYLDTLDTKWSGR